MKAKRRMLKVLCVVLISLFSTFLVNCGQKEKESGITIGQVEKALSSGDWSFTETVVSDGKLFEYEDDFYDIQYSCKTDKNENVVSINIKNKSVKTDLLTDSDSLVQMLLKSSDRLTVNELYAENCVLQFWNIQHLIDESSKGIDASEGIKQANQFFRGESVNVNDWSIVSTVDSFNRVVTIQAVYGNPK